MAKNTKRYILTIEYNEDEDRCEYIEEKLLEESPDNQTVILGFVDLEDYFSESDLVCLMTHNIGKS